MQYCMGCMHVREAGPNCPFCGFVHGMAAAEAYHLPPETILQGRYIVGKVLGFGGFGVTYIGLDAQTERVVAIKEFLPTVFATRVPGNTALTVYQGNATKQFESGLSRFVDEARTLAQFNGIPGIVDIYDTFNGNNTAYIVMQFLKGEDLKHYISHNGVMDYETARGIIIKVCETLERVHAKNIIHRDISPDNIYITDSGEIKLLDFGAARYESAFNSKSLSVILKSGYAPEEQYRSKGEQGSWTDVYALSATFYKLLTGKTPPDSMERAINDEIVEPGNLVGGIPSSAQNAIMNALNVRQADRTQTAAQFREELLGDGVQRKKVKKQSVSTGMPVGAKVGIACCIVLALALGLFTATGGFGNAVQEVTYGSEVQHDMPDIVGMSIEEAETVLSENGFTPVITRAYVTKNATANTVVAQELAPDTQHYVGTNVNFDVSVGSFEELFLPGGYLDVVGTDAQAALDLINNLYVDSSSYDFLTLYTDFTAVESSEEQKGKVLAAEYVVDKFEYEYIDDEPEYSHTIELQVGIGPKQNETFTDVLLSDMHGYYFLHDDEKTIMTGQYYTAQLTFDGGATWSEPIDHLFDDRAEHPNRDYEGLANRMFDRGYLYYDLVGLLLALDVPTHAQTMGATGEVSFAIRMDTTLHDGQGGDYDEHIILDGLTINTDTGQMFKDGTLIEHIYLYD